MKKIKKEIILILTFFIFTICFTCFLNNVLKNSELPFDYESFYQEKIDKYQKENEKFHYEEVDVVFLGDSLTDMYDVEFYYHELKVLNRGISGDTTTRLFKRLEISCLEVEPKVIVMLIGINNIKTMFEDYENILQWFTQNLPKTDIVLLSLTSMTRSWAIYNDLAKEANEIIQNYAMLYGFTYIDLYNLLLDETTQELKEEYTIDGGHFTERGYQVITSKVKPIIMNIIKTRND